MHRMQSGAISLKHRGTGSETIASDELARAAIEARTVLEAAANAAAEAAEQALAVAAALDEALAQLDDHADPDHEVALARSSGASATLAPLSTLSPREQEVLALVARGFTNKHIAETLYVSPNTVKTHVASLLHKLDAGTRAHLAAIATRQEQGQRELV
jgi:DNA-binding NarL/FixJ family response regulator